MYADYSAYSPAFVKRGMQNFLQVSGAKRGNRRYTHLTQQVPIGGFSRSRRPWRQRLRRRAALRRARRGPRIRLWPPRKTNQHACRHAASSSPPRTGAWCVSAGVGRSPEAGRALATLCENYWFPLYAFVRRAGYSAEDAQDLTQEFFARLLAKNYLAVADQQRGRFRSFLLGAMKHFLAKEERRQGRRNAAAVNPCCRWIFTPARIATA